jgi:hypothetical protein
MLTRHVNRHSRYSECSLDMANVSWNIIKVSMSIVKVYKDMT